MKLKIADSTNKMSFTASTSDIKAALSKVEGVTNYSSVSDIEKSFVLCVSQSNVYIIGYSPETFVLVKIKATDVSAKSSSFEFVPSILSGLIAGRADLNFEYDGSRLKLTAVKGKYSCELLTKPITDDQLPRINKALHVNEDKAKSLDSKTLTTLREGIRYAELKDVYAESGKGSLLCLITLSKGELTVDAFDNFHLSSYRATVKSKEAFRLAVSEASFALIDKFLVQEDIKADFFVSDTGLRVQNDDFVVVLPPIQVDQEQYNLVSNYLKTLHKPSITFAMSKDAISTVNNMLTLAGKDSRFEFALAPTGVLKLSLSVDGGDVHDAFKCKEFNMGKSKGFKFKVDPRLFVDLFRKLKGESAYPVELHFSKDDEDASSCFVTRCDVGEKAKLILLGTYHI